MTSYNIPLLGIYPGKMNLYIQKRAWTLMFIIAANSKQPFGVSTYRGMDTPVSTYRRMDKHCGIFIP